MCGQCGKLMGLEERCPWCGAARSARRRPRPASVGGHGEGVTRVLVGAIVIIYGASIAIGGIAEGRGLFDLMTPNIEFLMKIGLMNNAAVVHGDWWRLVAAVFLHLSLLHILFNAMALWIVGRPFEDDIGGPALWTIFLLTGVAGFALGLVFDTPGGGGASGGISGLIGAIIARRRLVDGSFDHPLTRLSLRFAMFTAIFGLAVPGINNVAHGGGFVAGALLGAAYSALEAGSFGRVVWRVGAVLSAVAAAGTVATIALASERVGGSEVMDMDRCIMAVSQTVERFEMGSPSDLTTPLDPCLDRTAPFADEADALPTIGRFAAAARKAQASLATGVQRDLEDAQLEAMRARNAWRVWVMQNLDRLGLRLGP